MILSSFAFTSYGSYFGSMGPEFLLIIIIGIAGFIVQARLQSVFRKYSQVSFTGDMTGKDVAEKMLRDHGITDVKVIHTPGQLTDHFNPANKTVNLSDDVYESNSVAAAAVAAHECGHAVQHAVGYAPLKLRSALVPVTSFSSRFAIFFIIGGILMILGGFSGSLLGEEGTLILIFGSIILCAIVPCIYSFWLFRRGI